MNGTPEKALNSWLRRLHIPVSVELINRQLKSHPDYPSLLSITDTLDYLGIENAAVQIEKEFLHEITPPFLAHLKTNGGEFVLAENRDTLEQTYPGFFNTWSGVVVMAEKSAQWSHKENDVFLKNDKQNAFRKNTAIAAVLFVSLAAALLSPGWMIPGLLTVALAGVFVSWLIVSRELGIENGIADQACGKEAGCDDVIKSAGAKLPWGIAWSDIGITWFRSLLLVLLITSFTKSTDGILALLSVLSAAALPFTFFSVYYQWRVAKKWCRLCLITVGLLLIQFTVLSPVLITGPLTVIESKDVLILFTILLSVSIAWFAFKNILSQKNKWEEEALKGIRFKRNESVFAAMLQKQRMVDATPWENDMQLGNSKAPVQIMVACNPYCGPCAKAHETLHELIETHSNAFGLTIRFTLAANHKQDKRTEAVRYILQHIEEKCCFMGSKEKAVYTRELLHHWFRHMNYETFTALFPNTQKINVTHVLLRHEEWSIRNNIRFTPTIFINGRELPAEYTVADIAGLMNVLPDIFQSEQEVNEPEPILA